MSEFGNVLSSSSWLTFFCCFWEGNSESDEVSKWKLLSFLKTEVQGEDSLSSKSVAVLVSSFFSSCLYSSRFMLAFNKRGFFFFILT